MDPLADKLLTHRRALVSLVQMDLAPAWVVAVILGREFAGHGTFAASPRARRGDCGVAARQVQDGLTGDRHPSADPRPRSSAAVLRARPHRLMDCRRNRRSPRVWTTTAGFSTSRPAAESPRAWSSQPHSPQARASKSPMWGVATVDRTPLMGCAACIAASAPLSRMREPGRADREEGTTSKTHRH